jgi:hypothetical protein
MSSLMTKIPSIKLLKLYKKLKTNIYIYIYKQNKNWFLFLFFLIISVICFRFFISLKKILFFLTFL